MLISIRIKPNNCRVLWNSIRNEAGRGAQVCADTVELRQASVKLVSHVLYPIRASSREQHEHTPTPENGVRETCLRGAWSQQARSA